MDLLQVCRYYMIQFPGGGELLFEDLASLKKIITRDG